MIRNPFSFLFARSSKEEQVVAYITREHRRGRRLSDILETGALVGIDPDSDGLARARRLGVPAISTGVEGLMAADGFEKVDVS